MDISTYLVSATVAILAYPLLLRRLRHYMKPMRMRMAELGGRLENDPLLSEKARRQVKWYLDNAFNPWAMVAASITLPVIPIVFIRRVQMDDYLIEIRDEESKQDYDELASMFTRSAAAANPIFALIVGIEMVVLFLVLLVIGDTSRAFRKVMRVTMNYEARIIGDHGRA